MQEKAAGTVVPTHVMKAYAGVQVQLHSFLTSTLDVDEWSASCAGRFTPGAH
jgi:hypothetical protein